VNRLEYWFAAAILGVLGWMFSLLPLRRRRVVLATARTSKLDGNLLFVHRAMRAARPDLEYVLHLEPYGYDRRRKLAYLGRLVRGMYHLQTSRLVVVDNAYLPVHVRGHRRETTVVQVWHAAGALKRFGADTTRPLREPERTFLHRNYDYVITSGEAAREPYAAALRTPVERVLALGSPRTDFFFDEAAVAEARARVLAAFPVLAGRRVVIHAPTFRGRGAHKLAAESLDAERLRRLLPPEYALIAKTHPNLPVSRPDVGVPGFDVVIGSEFDINELFTVSEILITDYSSCIFDFALLRKPIVLLVGDLEAYEADPGLYLDYRTEMIGTQVASTDETAEVIVGGRFDLSGYDAFIERHLGAARGDASARFVGRFLGKGVADPVLRSP
jgi:CDP-ribitol ribitolphosphotransferase